VQIEDYIYTKVKKSLSNEEEENVTPYAKK